MQPTSGPHQPEGASCSRRDQRLRRWDRCRVWRCAARRRCRDLPGCAGRARTISPCGSRSTRRCHHRRTLRGHCRVRWRRAAASPASGIDTIDLCIRRDPGCDGGTDHHRCGTPAANTAATTTTDHDHRPPSAADIPQPGGDYRSEPIDPRLLRGTRHRRPDRDQQLGDTIRRRVRSGRAPGIGELAAAPRRERSHAGPPAHEQSRAAQRGRRVRGHHARPRCSPGRVLNQTDPVHEPKHRSGS